MEQPSRIHIYIKLKTENKLDQDLIKAWLNTVKKYGPNGVVCGVVKTDPNGRFHNVPVVHRELANGGNEYIIALTRDLTEMETSLIVSAFMEQHSGDWDIETSAPQIGYARERFAVEVKDDSFKELCTSWSKTQHEAWVTERLSAGWRLGGKVSETDKTHPLLRPWHELPDEFRKVDGDMPQKFLDFLNASGYVVLGKDEMEALKRLAR